MLLLMLQGQKVGRRMRVEIAAELQKHQSSAEVGFGATAEKFDDAQQRAVDTFVLGYSQLRNVWGMASALSNVMRVAAVKSLLEAKQATPLVDDNS